MKKTIFKYSIFHLAGDPPEPEELIKALLSLENSASSDANIRERIANLPPEVSEIALLSKLEDKEAAAKLIVQVRIFLLCVKCCYYMNFVFLYLLFFSVNFSVRKEFFFLNKIIWRMKNKIFTTFHKYQKYEIQNKIHLFEYLFR